MNQLTGLILWEDWRTIRSWVSYVGIHVLILLGTYDISSADLFEHVRETRRGNLAVVGKSLSMPVIPFVRTSGRPEGTTSNGYAPMET